METEFIDVHRSSAVETLAIVRHFWMPKPLFNSHSCSALRRNFMESLATELSTHCFSTKLEITFGKFGVSGVSACVSAITSRLMFFSFQILSASCLLLQLILNKLASNLLLMRAIPATQRALASDLKPAGLPSVAAGSNPGLDFASPARNCSTVCHPHRHRDRRTGALPRKG